MTAIHGAIVRAIRAKLRASTKGGIVRDPLRILRVVTLAGLCLVALWADAQSNTGRILGAVSDATGAVLPGATITITDISRGQTRTVTSDAAGEFVAPDLLASIYRVRAEIAGFKTGEVSELQLEVAQDRRADFTLQPGDNTDTVVVTGQTPLLETVGSSLGGTLSNQEINQLPLDGRNYENLLQLRPGVVRYPGGGFSTTSTNGLRAEDNAYIVDGLFNSEPFSGQSIINGAGIAGDSATILPVDAIQEFNLLENPPAEYGWKPGAMVIVGLKSGTDTLHGTAFVFGRTTALDARNFFNRVETGAKNSRALRQYGASVGGPIQKDKLFYFGAFEGQRYTVSSISQLSSPSTVSLGGDPLRSVPDAIAAVQQAGLPVSQPSLKIAGCTLGPPISCDGTGFPTNLGVNPGGPTTITFALPNSLGSQNALGKLDYQLNARHTLNGLYFFGDNHGTVSDAGELQLKWLTQIHTLAQVAGASWTWIPSSHWVNELRFGFNRLYQPTFTNDHSRSAASYGLNTGVTNPLYGGLPRINLSDYYVYPQELGGFNWPKVQGPDTRFQLIDHLSWSVGKHAFKFGGELHRDDFTGGAFGGVRGRIKFGFGAAAFPGANSVEDFFAGYPASGSILTGDPTRNISNYGVGSFVQDDWHSARNLTLNLGLRYELNTVIKEAHNRLGNFDPTLGLEQVGRDIRAPYRGDHNSFAPRLGFNWDPQGTGQTVVRGGFGVTFETINWESFLALNNSFGIESIPTGALGVGPNGSAGTGDIAVGTVNYAGAALNWNAGYDGHPGTVFSTGTIDCGANPCSILGIVRDFRTPFVYGWDISVQHSFTRELLLEVAYVGNHGANLVGIHDINQNRPALDLKEDKQSGRPFNAAFPYLSFIYQLGNIYKSNYDGLQATVTGRNYHGFTWVSGYTYSHSLDDVGANWDFGEGNGLPQDSTYPTREYASSDFDFRHRVTLSGSYAVPAIRSFAQLLSGWQINSIVNLYSAQPWGPIDSGNDLSETGEGVDRWDFFGNVKDFKSGAKPTPFIAGGEDPLCMAHARSLASLATAGCYRVSNSVMTPPAPGTFGTMGRNTFRDAGFINWDFSTDKTWEMGSRWRTQFRAEFFNLLNHPNIANPFGGQNGWGHNDPSVPGSGGFGCGCATPDVAASNPVIGSGGSRAIQLGLKVTF